MTIDQSRVGELENLLEILADWASHPGVYLTVFGSRVRGDHRPDSDVDLRVRFGPEVNNQTATWWTAANEVNSLLPGRLEICDGPPSLQGAIDSAKAVRSVRNVRAVILPPKPSHSALLGI